MESSGQLSLFPSVEIAEKDRERFWSKIAVGAEDECWEWQAGRFHNGYGCFSIKHQSYVAHRIAYHISKGFIPEGMFVLHACDNKPCCNPRHLHLGDAQMNMDEMRMRGRGAVGDRNGARLHPETHVRGERQHSSKLTADQVQEVLRRYREGAPQTELAADLGVTKQSIWAIVHGRKWKHLTAKE